MITNSISHATPLPITTTSNSQTEKDWENLTLLKVAACIPVIGLVISHLASNSLTNKLENLSLPERLRPLPRYGNMLNANASPEENKAACERAIQLKSIDRDYTKAIIVNTLLTIALLIYELAVKGIPLIGGTVLISVFTLTTARLTFVICADHSIERYKKISATYVSCALVV